MVEGESGLLAIGPPQQRPQYEPIGLYRVSLLYQKGRHSRIFQVQDRAIDDFTSKGMCMSPPGRLSNVDDFTENQGTAVLTNSNLSVNNCYYLTVATITSL